MKKEKIKIAIFASGRGSNAEKIIEYFQLNHDSIEVDSIFSNKKEAKALELAIKFSLNSCYYPNNTFKENSELIIEALLKRDIKFIILSGFLLKIPIEICKKFENRIINIHPSLLPKYGGKGMYGQNVHTAVKEANEIESGISIHLVNEKFDDGRILFQKSCSIKETDTIDAIASKVLALEHKYFPQVIDNYILNYKQWR